MRNINWKPIKNLAGKTLELVGYGALVAIAYKLDVSRSDVSILPTSDGYSDAVNAIMGSDMTSYYKKEAIAALKRNGDPEFYRAVSNIARDKNTVSYYRCETIKNLSAE